VKRALLLFALALVLRVGYIVNSPQLPVVGDAGMFRTLGTNLAIGVGFSNQGVDRSGGVNHAIEPEYWSPGYPLMLAAVYRVFGMHDNAVRLLQALLGALTVVLVAGIAKTLFDDRTAKLAALIALLYPGFIIYTGTLLSEAAYTFLVTAMVYVLLRHPFDWRWNAVVGVLLGFGALMRSDSLALPLAMLAFVLLARRLAPAAAGPHHGWVTLAGNALAMFVAMSCVVLPWTVRNYQVLGKFILVDVHGGYVLWISTYPEDWLEWKPLPEEVRAKLEGLDSSQRNIVMAGEAVKNLVKYPGPYVRMTARRFVRFWAGSHTGALEGASESFSASLAAGRYGVFAVKAALLVINSLLVVGGLIGAWRFTRDPGVDPLAKAIVVSPIVFKAAVHTLLYATSRYQIPIMPLLIVLAASWCVSLKPLALQADRSTPATGVQR
jgi:hypothetical protein